MLSYRHGYHAGSFADVFKHTILIAIIRYLQRKDTALCYIDTHAGAGQYTIAHEYMQKTKEYASGIEKLYFNTALPDSLRDYQKLVRQLNFGPNLAVYPGSPVIARTLLRPQDRMELFELHSTDAALLTEFFKQDSQAHIHPTNVYETLFSVLPPAARRGFVLIDPSYEVKTEYDDVLLMLKKAYQRFPMGIYAVWYPVLKRSRTTDFIAKAADLKIPDMLRVEWCPLPDTETFGMTGNGLLIVNAPYTLKDELKTILSDLSQVLSPEQGQGLVEQLIPE